MAVSGVGGGGGWGERDEGNGWGERDEGDGEVKEGDVAVCRPDRVVAEVGVCM